MIAYDQINIGEFSSSEFDVSVSSISRYLLRREEATRARDVRPSTSSRKLSSTMSKYTREFPKGVGTL